MYIALENLAKNIIRTCVSKTMFFSFYEISLPYLQILKTLKRNIAPVLNLLTFKKMQQLNCALSSEDMWYMTYTPYIIYHMPHIPHTTYIIYHHIPYTKYTTYHIPHTSYIIVKLIYHTHLCHLKTNC